MKNIEKILLLLFFLILNLVVLYYISTFFNIWYGLCAIGVISFCVGKTVSSRKSTPNRNNKNTKVNQSNQNKQTSQKGNSQKKTKYKEHDSYRRK